MEGRQWGQLARSARSCKVECVSLLNTAFALQRVTCAAVIYYKGRPLITYLQRLDLGFENRVFTVN